MITIYFNIYLLDNTCIDLRPSRTREDSRLSVECWCWGFWLIASLLARGFIIHHLPHSVTRSFQKTLIACYVPRGTVTPSVRESSAPYTQSSAADNTKSVGFVRHPETITFAIPRIALVKPAIESKRWWHIYDSGYRQYNTLLEIDRHCTMSRATYCILYTVVYIYLYYIIY